MELRDNRTRAVAVYSLLLSAALILSYIEALLPPLGIFKLGLANIAVTLGIYIRSRKCGFTVMLCRVIITSLLFGSVTTFLFSLFGGVLSWCIASILVKPFVLGKITLVGVSVLSAAAHNIGQIIAACIVFYSVSPLSMMWWMLLAAIPAGLMTGFCAQIIIKRIGGKI